MTIRPTIRPTLRRRAALAAGLAVALVGALTAALPTAPAASAAAPLTNLAHLDFLQDDVAPPTQANHTTYGIGAEPHVGVLWTYADRQADGTFHRVGGGAYNPTTDTWGQGAYNADDIARAAVVYLRHWKQTGADTSRDTRLRTAPWPHVPPDRERPRTPATSCSGCSTDGTLNPSATPKDDARPLGQRRVVLAGPHRVGARRGVRRRSPAPAATPSSRPSCATGSTSRSMR